MSDVDELGRRVDLLAGELRELVSWLKTEHKAQLHRIDDTLLLIKHDLHDHEKRITDLRIAVHEHGKRISALEQEVVKKKRGKK